jgi:hypothetical protein
VKGVTYIRITFQPEGACPECTWRCTAGAWYTARDVRTRAQQHVKDTGHRVRVDIIDRTEYEPEVTS